MRPRSLALALALAGAPPLGAQSSRIEALARVLAAEDARRSGDPAVAAALRSTDPVVRRYAALAAGRIGDRGATPGVARLLGDPRPDVRAAAAFALGLLRDSAAVEPLVRRLRRAPLDSGTAAEVVTALAKIGGRRPAATLAGLLEQEVEPPGAGGAAAVLSALIEAWRLPADQPIAALRRYAGDRDPERRWRAVYSLARLRTPEAAAELRAALDAPHPVARMYAARALGRAFAERAGLPAGEVTAALGTATGDPDPGVRIYALLALGTWRDSSLARYALARLDDSVVNVRVQAATALGGLGGAQAVAALVAARDAPAWALRREALLALARADSTAFQAAAADWAASPDWRERTAAAEGWAVTRPGEPGWRDDPDGRVVAAALQAWSTEVPGVDPALLAAARSLIGHPDAGVRSVAADVLARAADPADLPALGAAWRAAEQDSFPEAAQTALGALAAIAARSDTAAVLVERRFLAATSPPSSYLLRRWAAERWPAAAARWGQALPLETGRGSAEYRDIVRRRLLGAPASRRPRARFETEGAGTFEVELLGDEAPLTVEHFVTLARNGFFGGHRWHRVVPNFVVQDGDPRGDGWGGPPLPRAPRHAYAIRDEINRVRYAGPVLGMALSGPDTGNSQWFVNLSPQPHLDGTYTVFGRVVRGAGRSALQAITQGDRIIRVRVSVL